MSSWAGAVIAAVVMVAATGGGLVMSRRRGRFRATSAARPVDAAVADSATVAGAATLAGPAAAAAPGTDPAGAEPAAAALRSLGIEPGTPVTLIQFSSTYCASCQTTRNLCADVAERTPGVAHLDIDAESHLDAVRALNIWRTPTVLIVDDQGRVRARATGAPSRSELAGAIAGLLPTDRA